nr:MAG TPA: putative tail fiber protein [Caudoviricetes sp.]DAV99899.1 MAG TPA: putative tail fiber protein [Caudoviricetes sp.]DAX04445.1 MAG TPA: putative tail fiber protein [Bacteriophage sp.]
MPVQDWSATADENTSIDGINIAEHCPAKNMNDALRAVMASVKENDASVVHTAGDETITGAKTFTEKLFLAPKEDDRWLQTYIYGAENALSLKIQNRTIDSITDSTGYPARSSITLQGDDSGQGRFSLLAQSKYDTTNKRYYQYTLSGTSDGGLTWTGGNYSSLGEIEIVDSSNFSSDIEYIRYSSGLQICWGYVNLNGPITATNKRVTFPVAFITKPAILTTYNANAGNTPIGIGWESPTAFSIGTVNSAGSTSITSWIAIGPWK